MPSSSLSLPPIYLLFKFERNYISRSCSLRSQLQSYSTSNSVGMPNLGVSFVKTTQELASKGLSLLFDACDSDTQEQIVSQLVKGLQASRAASASSSGGDIATFAELSEIANNAGQPELVYKLMELSTTSSVWNTRKGIVP